MSNRARGWLPITTSTVVGNGRVAIPEGTGRPALLSSFLLVRQSERACKLRRANEDAKVL